MSQREMFAMEIRCDGCGTDMGDPDVVRGDGMRFCAACHGVVLPFTGDLWDSIIETGVKS